MSNQEMGMCPETIKKRDGKPVPFDARKIRDAVQKANVAAQVEDRKSVV